MRTARGECDGHGAVDTTQPNDEGARLNATDAVQCVLCETVAREWIKREREEREVEVQCVTLCVFVMLNDLGPPISLLVLMLHLGCV